MSSTLVLPCEDSCGVILMVSLLRRESLCSMFASLLVLMLVPLYST